MKILASKLIVLFLFCIQFSVEVIDYSFLNTSVQVTLEEVTCKYDQCHAIAKSTGKRCKHCVSKSGDRNCWQH